MHFFLQGEPKIGKSFAIQSAVKHSEKTLGIAGYTPQRLYDEQKNVVVGYRAELIENNEINLPLDMIYSENLSNVFLDFQKKIKRIDILENLIAAVYQKTQMNSYDLIVLDEIGGFELESDFFYETLLDIMDHYPCLGVLKEQSRNENHSNNGRCVEERSNALIEKIQNNGSLYTMIERKDDDLSQKLDHFMQII